MPKVHVKYQLTLDATVQFNSIIFQDKDFPTPDYIDGKDNLPVLEINVLDTIYVDLLMSGPAGKWTIALWVIRVDEHGNEFGTWSPAADNGLNAFTGNIKHFNHLSKTSKITWK